ncbi:MAG: fibronectin type III domain-containing protein [Bacteroidetes bacterium]|nr:fibronectin type III domain-containing protein [Bacteroidota bacterium]
MPTLHLRYNITNVLPAQTDVLHSRVFTVDFVDDRQIEEIKERDLLLNRKFAEDVLGIRRKLMVFLRTADVKNNIDFLTSFFNAPYKWALVPEEGYYFNLGTIAVPVAVPVVSDMRDLQISVPGLIKDGLRLVTAAIYPRPTAPVISSSAVTSSQIEVSFTTSSLKYRLFRAASSGGTLTNVATSTVILALDGGLASGTPYYYKGSVVTIGGESELSPEVTITTA